MKPVRVVQWATGNIGTRALREVIRHPDLELVGVFVYDDGKATVDAGALCGEPPVGVVATSDRAAVHTLSADCVLYMARAFALDDVLPFLEQGTNVVTTCGDLSAGGRALDAETRQRIEDACARGNTSVYATGSSPGFITDALPYALLSLQRRCDGIEIEEFADLSQRASPELLFDIMGFGRPPGASSEARAAHLLAAFRPALEELAEAAGRPVDAWSSNGEVAVARGDTTIAAGPLARGSVAAQRTQLVGRARGDVVVRFAPTWYCLTDVEPAWDLRPTGWRVQVHGDAPLDVALPFPVAVEALGETTPAYTANRPVNAIPYVCAARPGILSTADLPPILPRSRE
ncbi:MAG TPA: dihydrodipicolinate reductase [Acidimicrobiia bacterium]|nr:dihydrodipicolinate reductase [Acidimicrobiia bacterium]